MLAVTTLEPRFVKSIPRELESGVLYISMEYGTIAHSCCCGCGQEVVTPLTPTDWRLEYDGENITLRPSVGNWNLACRSHYIIRRNRVIECADWDDEMVNSERKRDLAAKQAFYFRRSTVAERPPETATDPDPPKRGWFESFRDWW